MRAWRTPTAAALLSIGLLGPLAAFAADDRSEPRTDTERVVLLHGLGRTKHSMAILENALERAGYIVANIGYPSREKDPQALLELVEGELDCCCPQSSGTTHFVTYSLGGILARAYLAESRPANLGRVVMIAPPNRGSDVVDSLGELRLFEWFFGPTAVELGTDPESLPNRLQPPDYELGVIAGNRSFNPLGSWLIPGDDDGTVAVDSTKIAGMTDFVVVSATHTFIMNDRQTVAEVLSFLRNGTFTESALQGPAAHDER